MSRSVPQADQIVEQLMDLVVKLEAPCTRRP